MEKSSGNKIDNNHRKECQGHNNEEGIIYILPQHNRCKTVRRICPRQKILQAYNKFLVEKEFDRTRFHQGLQNFQQSRIEQECADDNSTQQQENQPIFIADKIEHFNLRHQEYRSD